MQHRKVATIQPIEVKPDNSVCTQLSRIAATAGQALGSELFGFFKHVTDRCFKWDLRANHQRTVQTIKKKQISGGLR